MYLHVFMFSMYVLTRFWENGGRSVEERGERKIKEREKTKIDLPYSLQCCNHWVQASRVFACAPTAGAPPSGQKYSHDHLQRETNVEEKCREMVRCSGMCGRETSTARVWHQVKIKRLSKHPRLQWHDPSTESFSLIGWPRKATSSPTWDHIQSQVAAHEREEQ